ELYHGLPAQPGADELLALRRMGLLARYLETTGLPDEALSIGLLPDRGAFVEIVVQVFESDERSPDYGVLAP
nr:hypothetical protein [Kiloniellales bacterium]